MEEIRTKLDGIFPKYVFTDNFDIVSASLYDCLTVPMGQRIYSYWSEWFQAPLGQMDHRTGQINTKTNISMPGMLPQPKIFVVEQFMLTFPHTIDPRDVSTLLYNYKFRFYIGQKWFVDEALGALPIQKIMCSCPACGYESDESNSDAFRLTIDLKIPLVLENQIYFVGRLETDTPKAVINNTEIWLRANGYEARAIQ